MQTIKSAQTATVKLEQLCLRINSAPITLTSSLDQKIIQTLGALLPSAAAAYQQALADLQAQQRFSWRGPATDLREALRETLDHLAPDKDVQNQTGFKLEPDTKGPTMKQKTR